jgi:diguanylate cyclase (GGDEF)-like protein/PAS domain S-box-containing protein
MGSRRGMSDTRSEPENNDAVYKTLLESTKAIPWKIDWATMKFAYIGPQIEPLLGWTQDSWVTAEDWATRIHPEDRERVVNFCISQSKAGVDHEADYRALTRDNGFVWIRDVVRVLRDEKGETTALVGFMFDISEHKKAEQELDRLHKELETLAVKDGLTGVWNRRRFDSILEIEWAAARRASQPLSLIMLDVDFFKQYNDRYGHGQGDECLKAVARTFEAAAARPRDMVARLGGEEFAMILPETDTDAARRIAEKCLRQISGLALPHEGSAIGKVVTASMGIATVTPSAEVEPRAFIDAADKMLYKAKQNGRNRVEAARL